MGYNIVDGIEKVYFAIMSDTVSETYEAVELLSDDVVELGATPSQNITVVPGSNKEQSRILGAKTADVTLTVNKLETGVISKLLGMTFAKEGGIIDKGARKPYIALMVEKSMTEGMEYLTLFKGQFSDFEDKAKTKTAEGVELQPVAMSGQFSQNKLRMLKHTVRTTDTDFNLQSWNEKWGKQVIVPTEKQLPPPPDETLKK